MKQRWKFDFVRKISSSLVKRRKQELGEDKSLTSPNILREKENQSRNRLSLEDEDIDEVDVQKLKNEDSKGEKDHFALVVEKGCNCLSWG